MKIGQSTENQCRSFITILKMMQFKTLLILFISETVAIQRVGCPDGVESCRSWCKVHSEDTPIYCKKSDSSRETCVTTPSACCKGDTYTDNTYSVTCVPSSSGHCFPSESYCTKKSADGRDVTTCQARTETCGGLCMEGDVLCNGRCVDKTTYDPDNCDQEVVMEPMQVSPGRLLATIVGVATGLIVLATVLVVTILGCKKR